MTYARLEMLRFFIESPSNALVLYHRGNYQNPWMKLKNEIAGSKTTNNCRRAIVHLPLLSFALNTPTRTAVIWFSDPVAPPRQGCEVGVNS